MRKYKHLLFLMFIFTMTSCLEGNLDDMPEFEDNDITGIQRVEYRYISSEIAGANGQNVVKYVTLEKSQTIDKDKKNVKIKVTVPTSGNAFPAEERAKCTSSNIAVMVALSTAARITPVGDAPILGRPGNWSKANKYIVTAANGNQKEWTIEVTDFVK